MTGATIATRAGRSEGANGALSFWTADPPIEAELAKLVDTIGTRVLRRRRAD
jgi:hypothetical protein